MTWCVANLVIILVIHNGPDCKQEFTVIQRLIRSVIRKYGLYTRKTVHESKDRLGIVLDSEGLSNDENISKKKKWNAGLVDYRVTTFPKILFRAAAKFGLRFWYMAS